MLKTQANNSSTIVSFFSFLGFISFAIIQPVCCAYKTAICPYNQPDGTMDTMSFEFGTSWHHVWEAIQLKNYYFQDSEWRLVGLIQEDKPEDEMMLAKPDENKDGEWFAGAMRAVWEIADLNLEISGKLEITCGLGQNCWNFEPGWKSPVGTREPGAVDLVEVVILEITGESAEAQVQALTADKINIDYAIWAKHRTKSEADRIADRVRGLEDMTASSFRKSFRKSALNAHFILNKMKFPIDEITRVEFNSPTITRQITRHATAQAATINLQLGGKTVIDGTAGFAAKVVVQASWAETKAVILKQLGNYISQATHNILYSTVSQGGVEHDDETNLIDKDTIYVSVTQKVATINLQLGGKTVIDGTAGFAAKVNVQGSWAATKAAILKQLGNSISQATHDILYSTVRQRGAEHDDETNLSDNDTIYVSVTQMVFSSSASIADVEITAGKSARIADVDFYKIVVAIIAAVIIGVGVTIVIFIALWFSHRRKTELISQKEIELRKTQGTW